MDELVSIIMPVYNAERYLDKCLKSILGQSYKNIELIVINDGSSDQSGALCEKYAENDGRIKLVSQENQGALSARLRGIREAKGSLIGWADADDWMEADYLEKLVALQYTSGADIVATAHFHDIGNDHAVVKNGIKSGIYPCKEIQGTMLYVGRFFEYGITPQLYSKLFKAEYLKGITKIDGSIIAGDDAAILYTAVLEADTICVSEICGYHYVQHPGSVTKSVYTDEAQRIEALIEYLKGQFEKKNIMGVMQKQLAVYRSYLLALRQISFFDRDKPDGFILSPFGKIHKGEKIAIYGAGVLGQEIYRYLEKEDRSMAADWVDKNYALYRTRGLAVNPPERILDKISEIDYIIIANITETTAEAIKKYLLEMKVPLDKIRWFTHEFRGGSMMKWVIYGAQGIALGAYRAMKELWPEDDVLCFLVTSGEDNPAVLSGLPVCELAHFAAGKTQEEKDTIAVYIATPENVMGGIERCLDEAGLYRHIRFDSARWSSMQKMAFVKNTKYMPLEAWPVGFHKAEVKVYKMIHHKDKRLRTACVDADYIVPIQVGAAKTDVRIAEITDCTGDHISDKNGNYSELTGLYWIWKNRIRNKYYGDGCYYGLFHYRRMLELSDDDLLRLADNGIDVVLPWPMPYEPDIEEHHRRYLSDAEWAVVQQALQEVHPEYAEAFKQILKQEYLYNYNIIVARSQVLDAYCSWLFPVLFRIEEINDPKGEKAPNRFIGYVGETLETLYFMSNKEKFKIAHVGCKFLI